MEFVNKLVCLGVAIFVLAAVPAAAAEVGGASWYGRTGNDTASGEPYDGTGMTCAHRSAKFGTHLHVTDLRTGKTITCRVNDRGPFVRGRIVDLSKEAAARLGIISRGVAKVRVQ